MTNINENAAVEMMEVGDKNVTVQEALLDAHETLKYHLLGPSLTKAGQDSVDQQKVRGNNWSSC